MGVMSDVLVSLGFVLILVGIVVSVAALLWLVLSGAKSGGGGKGARVRGGGVIIVGPVPIVFGTDRQSVKVLLVLAIVLVTLLLVWTVVSQGLLG